MSRSFIGGMVIGVVSVSCLGTAAYFAYAGPLNPPAGAVSSTYKTLSEVEPRIAINSTNTPGDADSLFKITQPGSYYLTANIDGTLASGKMGIEIASSNVSIDLMGLEVRGGMGTLDGISVPGGARDNIRISNGLVRDWGGSGVNLFAANRASGAIMERIVVSGNASDGIVVDSDAIIRDCVANQNGSNGFIGGRSVVFQNCSADNNVGAGFGCGVGSSVTNCASRDNGSYGFACGQATVIQHCSAFSNGDDGFYMGSRSNITDCSSALNTGNGIYCTGESVVRGNQCSFNTNAAGNAAGIRVHLRDSRIEGNNCASANNIGIYVDLSGNFIMRNICSGNTLNWNVVSGNVCLVVQAINASTISGDTGGTAPGSTDPNANFTY